MKQRRILIIIAAFLAFMLVAGLLCGCKHHHKYDDDWSYNYSEHWKEPLCGDTDDVADLAPHTFTDDRCSVCGYQRPAIFGMFPILNDFHTEQQRRFLFDDYENILLYARGNEEKSLPDGIGLCWYYYPLSLPESELKEFRLSIIGERGEPINKVLPANLDENKVQSYILQNAYLNTRYDVEVQAIDAQNRIIAKINTDFTTASTGPRNLLVDGVTNVRDVGGYVTDQGTIKQGMLLRTARLNLSGSSELIVEISDEGKRVMLDELKVKTEMDLRSGEGEAGITQSVLGDSVNYFLLKMDAANMFEQTSKVKNVFDILCDPNSYPVFFHCHIGTDRTGFIAFLCEALLGADERTLYVDYLFSNFGHIGSARYPYTIFKYIEKMNTYAGDNLAEKTESYLLECGITREQIAAFKDIMLEK